MAIIGDLHLEPSQMPLFHTARQQMRGALRGLGGAGDDAGVMPDNSRVVQLGDLGGYSNSPGSRRAPWIIQRLGCGCRTQLSENSATVLHLDYHLGFLSVCRLGSRSNTKEGNGHAAAARWGGMYAWP